MEKLIKFLFLFLFLSFIIEFSFQIKISVVRGVSLKNLAIYLMIITLVIRKLKDRATIIEKHPINLPIIGFFIYCFLSLFLKYIYYDGSNALILKDIIYFKSYMDPFIMSIIVFNLVNNIREIKFILFSLLALLLIFNLMAIFDFYGIFDIEQIAMDLRLGRSSGAFSESNQFAAYIALFIPFCLNTFFNDRNPLKQIMMLLIIVLSIYNILLLGSRGGILAFAIGLIARFILNDQKITLINLVKISAAVILFVSLIIIAFNQLPDEAKTALNRNIIERASKETLDEYSSSRLGIWQAGLKLYAQNPILGSGWRTFSDYIGSNSHNDFLLHLTTLGFPGFILFCSIFYVFFKTSFKMRLLNTENRWYYNSFLAGLCTFFVSSFLNNSFQPLLFFFFIFSGLILKMGFLENQELELVD